MSLKRLFGGRPAPVRASVPDGVRVWAVGDIHGRADLLERLVDHIVDDLSTAGVARRVLIFLGDYIDRGPSSRKVLDGLIELGAWPDIETHFLRGNHDDWMLRFLSDPALGVAWCDYGGRDTLWSYGVEPPRPGADAEAWRETADRLIAVLPTAHRRFLEQLEPAVEVGDYFFSHAGARPGVPLVHQSVEDLMWIRAEFLGHPARFEKLVVHGHTPEEAAFADHRRIGVDTGAYATNVLTGLRLEGADRQLAQTQGAGVVRRPF